MHIHDSIIGFFEQLPEDEQVAVLAELYYYLDDYHKDEFLRETENA